MEAGDEEEGSKEVKVLAKFRLSSLNIKKPKNSMLSTQLELN